MGDLRQAFDLAQHHLWGKAKIGRNVYVSDMARVRGRPNLVTIGAGVHLYDFCVLLADAPLTIGQGVRIGFGAHLLAHAALTVCANVRVGGGAKLLAGYYGEAGWETGPIEVGTGAVIGPGAVIMPGNSVPAGTVVAPNEVVDA